MNKAHLWIEENPTAAKRMLVGTFTAKDIGITRFMAELHRFGYVRKIRTTSGDRAVWEATAKLKTVISP